MNRNVLKIIAFVSMIVDHIGAVFFPNIIWFRVVGRIAMPIFAFFVAEGYFYTRNKVRYVLTLLGFMLIAWLPFCFGLGLPLYKINILGVFLISLLGMFLVDKLKNETRSKVLYVSLLILYFVCVFAIDILGLIPEGVFGVPIPIVFYAFRDKKILKMVLAGVLLVVISLLVVLDNARVGLENYYQFASLLAIIPICLYSGSKGKLRLKYLFYIGYPAHLGVLWILKLLII